MLAARQKDQSKIVRREPLSDAAHERDARRVEAATDRSWSNDHSLNLRLSIPFFGQRYYFVCVGGRERRSAERRAAERKKHPIVKKGNVIFLAAISTLAGLALYTALQWLAILLLTQPERLGLGP